MDSDHYQRRLSPWYALLAAGGLGCEAPASTPGAEDAVERSPDEELVLHGPVTCAAGVDGIARFCEESALRGLDRELSDPGALDDLLAYGHGGSTIAQDFDGDGDIDLMFGRFDGPPDLYLNDGGGSFDRVLDTGIVLPTMIPFETTSMSAVDLDDDRIPEILLGSGVEFVLYRSTGTGTFGEFEDVYFQASAPRMDFLTHNWGDPDGDGDLDLFFASASSNVGDEGDPEVLLWQDDGAFDRTTTLDNGRGTTSLLGLFTDMDGDQAPRRGASVRAVPDGGGGRGLIGLARLALARVA